MQQKQAQLIFFVLNIIAIPLVVIAINDFVSVTNAILNKEPEIPFDNGTYYFYLASVFWLMSLIQHFGKKDKRSFWYQHASLLLVGWFVFCLLMANVIPVYLKNQLSEAGYTECLAPDSIQRAAISDSLIFILGKDCPL